jgi:hypothetical protein
MLCAFFVRRFTGGASNDERNPLVEQVTRRNVVILVLSADG